MQKKRLDWKYLQIGLLLLCVIPNTEADPSLHRVDTSTLTGKVMCGYQGWFTCEGDDAGRGWFHYSKRGAFKPGFCTIDLWPDVSELDENEKYPTPFQLRDGQTAYVFSSINEKTVLRHFQWMQDYGIDGVFIQRFAVQTFQSKGLNHCDTVLRHCRKGANQYGRAYAIMYDLSGMRSSQTEQVINDWKHLVDDLKITRDADDSSYLHHKGKPVIALWGIGINDKRPYTLQDCDHLLDFFKNDPTYGGCTVMVGVPTYWRTLNHDAVEDPYLLEIIKKADIVSPWTVGRYHTVEQIEQYAHGTMQPDLEWCKPYNLDYFPVVFPGFSWHNMNSDSPLNMIPRQKGQFLWKQYVEAKRAGATMIYQAMFDEMDEGTAIFKCTNEPPVGESSFLTYEGLPSDYYLWLVGQGGEMLRDKIHVTNSIPARTP